jgi:hypothetical protein
MMTTSGVRQPTCRAAWESVMLKDPGVTPL